MRICRGIRTKNVGIRFNFQLARLLWAILKPFTGGVPFYY